MIAIIDLDSTLIDTAYNEELEENEFIKKIPKLGSYEPSEYVILRPNTDHLLSYCKKNFKKVILCTFSKWNRASIIIDILGIEDYFDEIVAFEKLGSDQKQNLHGCFIVVDDAPWNSVYTMRKLEFFGIDFESFSKRDTSQIIGCNKNINHIVVNVIPYDYRIDKSRNDMELIMATEKVEKIMETAEERKQKIFDRIKPFIKKIVEEDTKIHRQSNVFMDLGFEELMLADLFFEIEDELSIDIPDELTDEIKTVDDILTYIDAQLLSM